MTSRTAPGRWRSVGLAVHTAIPLVVLVAALALTGVVPQGRAGTAGYTDGGDSWRLFLGLGTVVLCCLAAGVLAERLRQPRVVGEILAGLALGPSLLGSFAPGAFLWLFPESTLVRFDGLAQLGLILLMFEVGRELRSIRLKHTASRSLFIAQSSVLMPLGLGVLAAVPLMGGFRPEGVHPWAFALFIGCALSITAVPVLARILQDVGLIRTDIGRMSLFVASVGDGCGWILLIGVTAFAQGGTGGGLLTALLGGAFVAAFFLGPLRVLGTRLSGREGGRTEGTAVDVVPALVALIAVIAALTSAIGIHQLIGALLVGAAWPAGSRTADAAATISRVRTVLLPFFFFGFGLTVDATVAGFDRSTLGALALLFTAAVVSKLLGPGLCAWLTGMPLRQAFVLGALLNTRGLTELIVITIGHKAGIIDDGLFVVLTAVALATTVMTGPLLRLALPAPRHGPPGEQPLSSFFGRSDPIRSAGSSEGPPDG